MSVSQLLAESDTRADSTKTCDACRYCSTLGEGGRRRPEYVRALSRRFGSSVVSMQSSHAGEQGMHVLLQVMLAQGWPRSKQQLW